MDMENQDVQVEDSSASEQQTNDASENSSQDAAQAGSQEGQEQNSGQAASQKEDVKPFHEHPRFRELVEQKNQATREVQELRRNLQQMQSQWEQMQKANTPKQEDKLLARLQGIDPEFAERFSELDSLRGIKDELRQELLNEIRQENAAREAHQNAVNALTKLHEEHKVPKEWQTVYNARLEARAAREKDLTPADLPRVYKEIHDEINAAREQDKRSNLATYANAKKQDAAKPGAQPKGKAPANVKGTEFSKDPAEARAQLVKSILNQSRAEREV